MADTASERVPRRRLAIAGTAALLVCVLAAVGMFALPHAVGLVRLLGVALAVVAGAVVVAELLARALGR